MPTPPPISQNPDIRFLGKLLGDVIRAYGGEALYRRIEYIRASSVDRHRGAAGVVETGLGVLSLDDTLAFVRGFMLFSMLANLAEDRQDLLSGSETDFAGALDRLESDGVSRAKVAAMLEGALIVPVLTAHPTEVRRKSMIDHRNRIAELMRLRDEGLEETPEGDRIDDSIIRQIALLWQTRALRHERLYVADEVENALSYLREIFLPTLPGLYARWERALGSRPRSFLRLGSWIGGDRDGNPNVTAQSLELALARSAETALVHYLEAVHGLGAELSISSELAEPDADVEALAEAGGDATPHRGDEPYRRALAGIYARLAATHQALTGKPAPRPTRLAAEPYEGPRALQSDLRTIARALAARGGE
ncbi:MAG: phosphoenolpyruvate carboxylase, partial [Sphingomonadaceae bacterium]|nr:phosphoenolpyruvate carboxylase [Sphingomonadaceae bacterium]